MAGVHHLNERVSDHGNAESFASLMATSVLACNDVNEEKRDGQGCGYHHGGAQQASSSIERSIRAWGLGQLSLLSGKGFFL